MSAAGTDERLAAACARAAEAIHRDINELCGCNLVSSPIAEIIQREMAPLFAEAAADAARLDWLEAKQGSGLISDDFGRWAVSGDGTQNVPEDTSVANDIVTTFFVEAGKWQNDIRAAIDKATTDPDYSEVSA